MGRRRVNIKADRDSLQSQAEMCHGQCRVQMSDVRDTVVYTYSRVYSNVRVAVYNIHKRDS